MHSEGILAGELKHGPLALIDESCALSSSATCTTDATNAACPSFSS